MDIYEIRRKNLHQLIQKYEGAAAEAIVFIYQESIKGHVVDTGNVIRLISR